MPPLLVLHSLSYGTSIDGTAQPPIDEALEETGKALAQKHIASRAGSRGPKSASPPQKIKILKIGLKYGKYLYKVKSV